MRDTSAAKRAAASSSTRRRPEWAALKPRRRVRSDGSTTHAIQGVRLAPIALRARLCGNLAHFTQKCLDAECYKVMCPMEISPEEPFLMESIDQQEWELAKLLRKSVDWNGTRSRGRGQGFSRALRDQ